MILVDTSVWINYFNGETGWQENHLDRLLGEETIIIGDIILAEILQGFDSENDFHTAKNALDALVCVRLIGKEMAVSTANNYRLLRSKGITIRKTIDMIIATWCITHNVELLHNDRNFEHIERHLPLKCVSEQ